MLLRFSLLAAVAAAASVAAFAPQKRVHGRHGGSDSTTWLHVVTPIGPFCLFRSPYSQQMDPYMKTYCEKSPIVLSEIEQSSREMVKMLDQGRTPDRAQLLRTSQMIDKSIDDWLQINTRWRLSNDFQSRENGKLMEAQMAQHGETIESIAMLMRWKAKGMRAMADGLPPPIPTVEDYERLERMNQRTQNPEAFPSFSVMASTPPVTAFPFDVDRAGDVLKSPTVQQELAKL